MKTFHYIAIAIVTVVFIAFISIAGYRLYTERAIVNRVEITYTLSQDSISTDSLMHANKQQIDALVKLISRQEEELIKQYDFTVKARADEADLTKILSCVGAFVLAILAFFGINSYKALQEKLIETAETKAEDTATEKIDKIVKSEVSKSLNTKINNKDFAATIKRDITNDITSQHLVRLEGEINRLKENASSSTYTLEAEEPQPPIADDEELDFEPMGDVPDLSTLTNN